MMDAKITNLEDVTDVVAIVIPVRDQLFQETNGVPKSEEEINQPNMLPEENNEQMASRSADHEIKTRSFSPSIGSNNGNKRPAIICDFFARGWCIKGSSCRFLHKKDHVDSTIQQLDGEVAAVDCKKEIQLIEVSGSKDFYERSRLPSFPESLTSSAGNNTACSSPFSLETTMPWEHGESQRCQLHEKHKFSSLERRDSSLGIPMDPQRVASSQDDQGCMSSFKDVNRERLRHTYPSDETKNHAHPSLYPKNSLFPEYGSGSSGSVISSSSYLSGTFNNASNFGELACNKSQSMQDHTPLSLSPSNTSLLTTGMLSSHRFLSSRGSPLSFSSSSLNASPSRGHKLLDGDRDFYASRSASLMQRTSPFSCSEPEYLSPMKASGDPHPLQYGEFKSKIPRYNWEPSVPFRPSFFIPHTIISSMGSQYDPLHDSIEESNIGDISRRLCASSEGASVLNTSQRQIYGNSVLFGTQGIDHNYINDSISSHNSLNENVLYKNSDMHKDLHSTGVEAVGTSDIDPQSVILAREDNPLGPPNMHEISITNKLDIDGDASNQSDGAKHKKDSEVDLVRQNDEMDVESKRDGDMHKESKALRHLHAALVGMVKDLLKPTWREGHLSKDAHNVIVKKTADKVLSTVQPHQIPSTTESIKQYLSSSQPKIAKLVEAYIEKHGNS